MVKPTTGLCVLVLCLAWCACALAAEDGPAPFAPDAHTLLLYHFDEEQGAIAKDASQYGYDGRIEGACRTAGKFGGALEFDGCDDCVFREQTEAIRGLKQITVECWFRQTRAGGRQFLAGLDAGFHFDLSGGRGTSLSIYNKGASEENADGIRHQHLGAALGAVRWGRWHHVAATYDGQCMTFFLDGVLKNRLPAAKAFSLGAPSRGLWIGCYVGREFWFSGSVDEFRVSDCVRYDAENKLAAGDRVFPMPDIKRAPKTVRKPQLTGKATLSLTLKWLYGGKAAGWVYLKPPGQPAAIVGRYELQEQPDDAANGTVVSFDVSDELHGDGCYLLGLESTEHGYFAVTQAVLHAEGKEVANWAGELKSRRTFHPPLLAPLQVGASKTPARPVRIELAPRQADRLSGAMNVEAAEPDGSACLFGEGLAEYWLFAPAEQTCRVYVRYVAPTRLPCDFVIDGRDLHAYHMATRTETETAHPRDALWEYQGTTTLQPGPHWVRVEGILPDIYGIRFEPVEAVHTAAVPWQPHRAPEGDFLGRAASWECQPLFGVAKDASVTREMEANEPVLRLSAAFANTEAGDLHAGDAVRLVHAGSWNLAPFGRLAFRFQGQGSGHVASIWLVDVKGDEMLLWRTRDTSTEIREVAVPISFEGNTVFDPTRVSAVCIELDEGNVRQGQVNRFLGAIVGPTFHRRDVIELPEDYETVLDQARQAMAAIACKTSASLESPGFRPWTKPVVPEEHPRFAQSDPKPVTRATLGYALHTTGARSIRPETLDEFHAHYDFGDVCWPNIGMCPRRERHSTDADYRKALDAFETQLKGVRDRGLFLFDIWGYVPHNADFPYKIAPEHHEILLRVFGDRFLGYDNGEQDGRYIGAYAGKGPHTNRKEGWEDFVRWDKHICADSQNYMNATGSLNFSHYYAERDCRMLGLETAQGLPSDTLLFAFLRGAGRQYGRLIYQASSIWNRFGYNMYHGRKTMDGGRAGYGYGPNKGCSPSLHRRLFFSGYLGGHSIFGTEASQFTADVLPSGARELSPLGRQHLDLAAWVRKHPDRGVMYTPVAFMLDFYNGWNMPRHLYRGDKYMIWGKFPYEKGDYLIDGMFRTVWPGYEDCSYLRNERGFLTPTPFGDSFDVITNRCPLEVLKQYTAVMLLGDVEMTPEAVENLTAFVRAGGDLIVDARRAEPLPKDIVGVTVGEPSQAVMTRVTATGQTFDELPYTHRVLTPAGATALLINEHGRPLITVNRAGEGRVIVGGIDHWMTDQIAYASPEIVNMEPPFLLLHGVRAVLGRYFDSFSPVEIAPAGLNLRTCCHPDDSGRLLVGLMNNDLFADWRGTLRSRLGRMTSVTDWTDEKTLPAGEALSLTIPAGDVAILDIRLQSQPGSSAATRRPRSAAAAWHPEKRPPAGLPSLEPVAVHGSAAHAIVSTAYEGDSPR